MVSPNWVDVILVLIIVLTINAARESNLFSELFILVGILLGSFTAVHYYIVLGGLIETFFPPLKVINQIFAFAVIFLSISILFSLIRDGWFHILKIEVQHQIDYWGAIVLAWARSIFSASLILFALCLLGDANISRGVKISVSNRFIGDIVLNFYSGWYQAIFQKFLPKEPLNREALSVLD